MTLAFLPGPTNSHSIHLGVALVGDNPRIGFFDANGMLVDTSFATLVTDAATSDQTCTLELALTVPGKQLFVQSKQHSPLNPWTPNSANTVLTQAVAIGSTSNPEGIASYFNVIVATNYGNPDAIWVDPTWPIARAGSGGPKAAGAPAAAASYFYLTDVGTSTEPKQLTLYVNVALDGATPYAWLSNADGVCVATTLVLCPPVDPTSNNVYCQLELRAGSIPSGYTVEVGGRSLPTHENLYYGLDTGGEMTFDVLITEASSRWTTSFICYGQTTAPGPVWTNR